MRKRIFIPVALAAVAALFLGMVAQGAEGDKVTGGGQTDVGTRGAGDTIAFVVMDKGGVRGQVQYVDREGGTGQGQTVYHGQPFCVRVEGNRAILAGTWRDSEDDFEIQVVDRGDGNGQDLIIIDEQATDPDCAEIEEDDEAFAALARGNVTVHNQD